MRSHYFAKIEQFSIYLQRENIVGSLFDVVINRNRLSKGK